MRLPATGGYGLNNDGLRCDLCGREERHESVNPATALLTGNGEGRWLEVYDHDQPEDLHVCESCWTRCRETCRVTPG